MDNGQLSSDILQFPQCGVLKTKNKKVKQQKQQQLLQTTTSSTEVK